MISDEAVEAAARETYRVAAAFAYETDSWDDLSDGQREAFMEDARKILEAAAPYLFAPLLVLADERDQTAGAIRGHVTTYELRQAIRSQT